MRFPNRRRRRRTNKITFNGSLDAPRRGLMFAQRNAILQAQHESQVKLAADAPTKSAGGGTARDSVQNH